MRHLDRQIQRDRKQSPDYQELGRGNGKLVFNGYGVYFEDDEKDSGDGLWL